ncbi:transposase [Streptosporangium amethystogenes subsp. fukuiense]|uniref:Transposase n=1 Tax=Streptosporangium amethystogenes subsp. fukuiense TaxID=698418 RepID=A0ABW2SUS2_9ACTN
MIDDAGFPKDGTASPGVTRQYSGAVPHVLKSTPRADRGAHWRPSGARTPHAWT